MLVSEFAIPMPSGLKGLAVYFMSEIIISLEIMESDTYFYGARSREKEEFIRE